MSWFLGRIYTLEKGLVIYSPECPIMLVTVFRANPYRSSESTALSSKVIRIDIFALILLYHKRFVNVRWTRFTSFWPYKKNVPILQALWWISDHQRPISNCSKSFAFGLTFGRVGHFESPINNTRFILFTVFMGILEQGEF